MTAATTDRESCGNEQVNSWWDKIMTGYEKRNPRKRLGRSPFRRDGARFNTLSNTWLCKVDHYMGSGTLCKTGVSKHRFFLDYSIKVSVVLRSSYSQRILVGDCCGMSLSSKMSEHQRSLSSESHIPALNLLLWTDMSWRTNTILKTCNSIFNIAWLSLRLLLPLLLRVSSTDVLFIWIGPPSHTYTHGSYHPLVHAVPLPLVCFMAVWRWGHTPALWVHPAVYVVGDVASRNPTHRTHWHG